MLRARERRFLVPEVVQTSSMDCGPAALKSVLEGHGIAVSYGRLREACQTDVDGTSIDTIEDVAKELGLEAEQVLVPLDRITGDAAGTLPAIVVTRLSSGANHFTVVWSKHGRFLQVMDPATGRRWTHARQFLSEVHEHRMRVPATLWRRWAGSAAFVDPLRARLRSLGGEPGGALVERALADAGWRSLAALDAAARMSDALVRAGALSRGRQTTDVVERLFEAARREDCEEEIVSGSYWTVRPDAGEQEADTVLEARGAVLVRVRGRRPEVLAREGESEPRSRGRLSPELAAALHERRPRPALELLRALRRDGLLSPIAIATASLFAVGAVLVQALLLRGWIDLADRVTLPGQRAAAAGLLVFFLCALLFLELPISAGLLRLGRHLEGRLRVLFQEKVPRLADRYFHSRPSSDMAERAHSIYRVRGLPHLADHFLRYLFQLVLTAAGIAWIDPASAPLAAGIALVSILLPVAAQRLVAERELRVRSHHGALGRFYLDSLVGLVPVLTHGAERGVRREHESLLAEWFRAGVRLKRAALVVEGGQSVLGFGLVVWLVVAHVRRGGDPAGVLLLGYWALTLPAVGKELARIALQYPAHKNATLRLLEPLGAPEDAAAPREEERAPRPAEAKEDVVAGDAGLVLGGPGSGLRAAGSATGLPARTHATGDAGVRPERRASSIELRGVSVRAAGHTILEGVDLSVPSGGHVAVVGPSGAGKSSLVGLLLGWHRPSAGALSVDGEPLDGLRLEALRRGTAWVDPAVQLWNRSLYDNVRYGAGDVGWNTLGQVVEQADLLRILERLPDGFQQSLGEGGGLVSGGEGQRVRLARALARRDVRLAILDEPFRGLDRERRTALLARARDHWSGATLFCVTHDIDATLAFDRVLVIEGGRLVEDGAPAELARRDSRYAALLATERHVREEIWGDSGWTRLRMEAGRLSYASGPAWAPDPEAKP